MENIKIKIYAASKDYEQTSTQSYDVNNIDENILLNIIKKAINKVKTDRRVFVVALMDVFLNGTKTHEIGIMSINGKPMINEIKHV